MTAERLDRQCGLNWASLSMQHSDWIDSGFITILEQDDNKGHPDLVRKGIPVAINFAKNVEDRWQVMELIYSQNLYGRPFIIPAGESALRALPRPKAFMEASAIIDYDPIPSERPDHQKQRNAGASGFPTAMGHRLVADMRW